MTDCSVQKFLRSGLLTVAETAELLHVSEDTVRREIQRGSLPAIRIATVIRIDPQDVVTWLVSTKIGTTNASSTSDEEGSND